MAGCMSMENPVFAAFVGYAALLLGKTMLMSVITAFHRITKRSFASDEDNVYFHQKKGVGIVSHPEVERVRRAHQNDLENIIPFILLGAIYSTTGPVLSTALLHFRIFTAARVMHSLVYLLKVPQPARAIAFFASFGVNVSLIYHIVIKAAF